MNDDTRQYLRIGEFAKLVGCSVVSLRYYEKIGALRPAHVDPRTGYRYYNLQQIYQARLVRMAIDAGWSPKMLEGYFDATDVTGIKRLFDHFTESANREYREAFAKKVRIEAMEVEYRRSLETTPIAPHWRTCREMLFIETRTSAVGEVFDFEDYLLKIRYLIATASELDIISLAQQGLHHREDDSWYAYIGVYNEPDLPGKLAGHDELRLEHCPEQRFLTKTIHGISIGETFRTGLADTPLANIDYLTELWAFTMVTGIASVEVTYRSDPRYPPSSAGSLPST